MDRTDEPLTEASKARQPDPRPLKGYAVTMGAFATYCAALVAVGRARGRRLPEYVETRDLVIGAAAVFRLSRLATKNSVTSPLRAPFTEYEGPGAPAESNESPRGTGPRHVIGELLTCPFCVSVWATATYSAGLVVAPRLTRFTAAALTVLTGSDLLQYAQTQLDSRTP